MKELKCAINIYLLFPTLYIKEYIYIHNNTTISLSPLWLLEIVMCSFHIPSHFFSPIIKIEWFYWICTIRCYSHYNMWTFTFNSQFVLILQATIQTNGPSVDVSLVILVVWSLFSNGFLAKCSQGKILLELLHVVCSLYIRGQYFWI